ncbi:hypothetical protein [Streptomyces sp. TRM64462]|uniref:hypothetical protein n=1 Tax=Streptomyces sp. TRM64462 TaxID=2741726 RepID=UPI0020C7C9B6|nr:hypothetical protein [Streptomyces sp. TRM64462]
MASPADSRTPAADAVVAGFRPTHVVPRSGMPAWETPGTSRPAALLDALLPVQLVDRMGDWARIVCSNGWTAWVDGRLLVAVPADPPAAAQDMARTADPRPLLARAEESVARYRRAAEDLAAGRSDAEAFRRGTGGLRAGVVVEGEAMWLYEAEHERWVYCDGRRLSTYAVSAAPAEAAPAGATPPAAEAPAAEATPPRAPAGPAGADRAAGPAGPAESRPPAADAHEPTRVVTHEPTQVVPHPGQDPPARGGGAGDA